MTQIEMPTAEVLQNAKSVRAELFFLDGTSSTTLARNMGSFRQYDERQIEAIVNAMYASAKRAVCQKIHGTKKPRDVDLCTKDHDYSIDWYAV